MTQFLTQENNQIDNSKNNPALESEEWFLSSQNQWFLSKESKVLLSGKDSWFVDPLQTVKLLFNLAKKNNKKDISKVQIQITKDRNLLQQYYDLRDAEYKSYNGWEGYSGAENAFDKKADIMVALKDNKVIAGLRVSIPDTGYLSNEIPEQNFTYKAICASCDINLEGVKYIEVSAIVVKTGFNSGSLLAKMLITVVENSRKSDIKYIFGVSTPECNRDYQLTLKKVGVNSIVVNSIQAPKKPKYNNALMNPIIVIT